MQNSRLTRACVYKDTRAGLGMLVLNKISVLTLTVRRPSVGLATLPHPRAEAVNLWTIASTSPMGLHGL